MLQEGRREDEEKGRRRSCYWKEERKRKRKGKEGGGEGAGKDRSLLAVSESVKSV